MSPDKDYAEFAYYEGFPFIDSFYLEVHYGGTDIQNASIRRVLAEKKKPFYATGFMSGGIIVDNGNIKTIGNVKKYAFEDLNIENAEDYARVNTLAWIQSYKGIINDDFLNLINTEEYFEQFVIRLKNGIGDKSNRPFLLKVDDKPVGVLAVRESNYPGYENCGELGAIYLLDCAKGQGYGKILFEKAVKELKLMGYTKMINGCIEGNPANSFYQHMGGKLIGNKIFKVPNGQELNENMYIYDNI